MTSTATLDDNTLIEMAKGGEKDCFSVLMSRHERAVRRFISSVVRNSTEVDDLMQNAFMKAWQHLPAFRLDATFRTWLTAIALNEALGLRRRRKCRPSESPNAKLEAIPSQCESPHQVFARSETGVRVRSAVAKLPAKYRDVLVLRDLEELTAQETAERMKASISLVKTRLFRARIMLSAALADEAA